MSAWGTGIKQSDEFLDVYEEFYDNYVDDADPLEIYREILAEYRSEFSTEDTTPLMYTVYYALAQCLWECGQKDPWLWEEIDRIIATDADLAFWDELGMKGRMKESRRRALYKFQEKLKTQPAKIRKPKKTSQKRPPTLHKGDLYAYSCAEGYRAALVLDYVWEDFLTAITETLFDHIPTVEEIMKAPTRTIVWFSGRESIPKKDRILIANIEIRGDYNNRAGLLYSPTMVGCTSIGERAYFFDLSKADPTMKRNAIGRYIMEELLNPNVLPFYRRPSFLP